jgi:hypothetical protein
LETLFRLDEEEEEFYLSIAADRAGLYIKTIRTLKT